MVEPRNAQDAALENFDEAADALNLRADVRAMMRFPERVLRVRVPVKMNDGRVEHFESCRVQHNTVRGPAKVEVHYDRGITLDSVKALAMTMTWRWAALGIPFGGASGGVAVDPTDLSERELGRLTRRYKLETGVIGADREAPARGMCTNRAVMAWIMDTYCANRGDGIPGMAAEKPAEAEPSGARRDAAGRGVFKTIEAACRHLGIPLKNARVAVQGFGAVGSAAALLLNEAQAIVVGASDTRGAIYNPRGLDIPKLKRHKERSGSVIGFSGSEPITDCELLGLQCDVLVASALANAIRSRNASLIEAAVVAEAARGSVTENGDRILEDRGVFVIPDVLCGAGGAVLSYFEWERSRQPVACEEQDVRERLESVMVGSFGEVLAMSLEHKVNMRKAASMLGISRVAESIQTRGGRPL